MPICITVRLKVSNQDNNIGSPEVNKIHHYISEKHPNDTHIHLLRNKEVIMWLFGDLSYLSPISKKNKRTDTELYKKMEDIWGQTTLKTRRPDLKLDKQWTNKFGEHICEELYTLLGKRVWKPEKKENLLPDLETNNEMVEVKTGTFNTAGTAGEKILGCPFKYSAIPYLYGKPLLIICVGGAEHLSREQYGNLSGNKSNPIKKKFLDFYRENQIEYIGATDILKSLVNSSSNDICD